MGQYHTQHVPQFIRKMFPNVLIRASGTFRGSLAVIFLVGPLKIKSLLTQVTESLMT